MNQEKIGKLLESRGFSSLKTNVEEIVLYYVIKRRDDAIYISGNAAAKIEILILCDFTGNRSQDALQLGYIIQKVSQDERFAAQEKQVLALLLTNDSAYGRSIIQAGIPAWIINAETDSLMIYEEQPEDFAGIRSALEGLLAQQDKAGKKEMRRKSQITPVNTALVAANVLIFLIMSFTGATGSGEQMIKWGAMYTPLMRQPEECYRVFTSMFLHFDITHLTGNMIILIALGDNLERAMGKWRYLLLYLLSGAGAGLISSLYNIIGGRTVVAAGASGAIFGVIGALFWLVLKNRGRLEELTTPRLGLMILYVLYSGFTTPGIDNAAHVGGLLTGILLTGLLKRRKRMYED